MICNSSGLSWSNPRCFMNPNEIIMGEMKSDSGLKILYFLAKRVCKAGESAHLNPLSSEIIMEFIINLYIPF